MIDYGTTYEALETASQFIENTDSLARMQAEMRKLRKAHIPAEVKRTMEDPNGIFIVAFSGGKDSVAMFLYLHFTLGIPLSRIELWHHEIDGGNSKKFDWPCTMSYCKAFADAFGAKLLFSFREGGIFREIYRDNEGLQPVHFQDSPGGELIRLESRESDTTRRKFPAISPNLSQRWCSAVVKIDVMSRCVANSPRFKSGNFIVCSGERREESRNRATYDLIEDYRAKTQHRNIYQWRPVLEWTEEEVWNEYRRHRVQPHPCYELGYSRCSCFTCIFLSPNGWASTAELAPDRIETIAETEKGIGHTLVNKMTIDQKVAKGTSFIHQAAKERWAEEAMSRFVSPIIVDNWTLPAGAFSKESAGSV